MTKSFLKTETKTVKDLAKPPEIEIRIVDDNIATCNSMSFFLESLGYKVKIWTNPLVFLSEHQSHTADGCILLDIRMPEISGLELLDYLNEQNNDLPIIFLTGHGDVEMAVRAMKRGAMDFLLKPPQEDKLISILERAVKISQEKHFQRERKFFDRKAYGTLTAREKEVIALVSEGLMNKIIADRLGISEKTVQQHRGAACRKLNLRNAVELADFLRRVN